MEDEILTTNYIDVLGKTCLKPIFGVFYVRVREYKSSKKLKEKVIYSKE